MKIEMIQKEVVCKRCTDEHSIFYKLDGWEEEDFLCSYCFVEELYESEAEYEIYPREYKVG